MRDAAARILVVDDDPQLRRMLRRYLETERFLVLEADDLQGVMKALKLGVDLITLDLNLGVVDGLAITRTVREFSSVPIIIITGKSDRIDTILGLEMGADDYIAKPFHLREVLARIRSVLRRGQGRADHPSVNVNVNGNGSNKSVCFDGYRLDFDRRELTGPDGSNRYLTTTDFDLLAVFANNPNRVLNRDRIMDLLKGRDWTPMDRTIDNQVARLRKKIEDDPSRPRLLKTVRGSGYCFTPADISRGVSG